MLRLLVVEGEDVATELLDNGALMTAAVVSEELKLRLVSEEATCIVRLLNELLPEDPSDVIVV